MIPTPMPHHNAQGKRLYLYLSGCYSSHGDDKENLEAFIEAASALRRLGHIPHIPMAMQVLLGEKISGTDEEREFWVEEDIHVLLRGGFDGIVMLPGWRKGKGPWAEWGAAIGANIKIYELTELTRPKARPG